MVKLAAPYTYLHVNDFRRTVAWFILLHINLMYYYLLSPGRSVSKPYSGKLLPVESFCFNSALNVQRC